MRKHTKAGLALLVAGMMMAGSVTSAFAETDATAATSGVIDTTKKTEVSGPGSTAASPENTSGGHTFSTEAPGSGASQTQVSGSSEAPSQTGAQTSGNQCSCRQFPGCHKRPDQRPDPGSGKPAGIRAGCCRSRSSCKSYQSAVCSAAPAASDHRNLIQRQQKLVRRFLK